MMDPWILTATARMVLGHVLADGLQGSLSGLKRRRGQSGEYKFFLQWFPYLVWHGAAHGFAVGWALGYWWLGLAEAVAHASIDFCKCEGRFGTITDQTLHAICKLVWLVWVVIDKQSYVG